jgi:hypothetical protein
MVEWHAVLMLPTVWQLVFHVTTLYKCYKVRVSVWVAVAACLICLCDAFVVLVEIPI